MRASVISFLLSVAFVGGLDAQSTLDRTPNVSGDWVVPSGTVQFNFLHRFVRSPAPARKISSFPTFLLAASFLKGTSFGFNYATNSSLVAAYPNEWEFFLRARPLTQGTHSPVDLAGQVGWNLAADGPDGELSVGRWLGRVRLMAVGRALSNPAPGKSAAQFALGGGATLKLTRHLSLQGDYVRLTELNSAAGEKGAWSAGLAVALPNTPHTLSLHATNTNTATLQGASRGASRVRYGFEFTIPITLARYFGHKAPAAPPAQGPAAIAPGFTPGGQVSGALFKTAITGLKFVDGKIEIPAGTTIEWKNDDALPHTVTGDGGGFDSGNIESGQFWQYTFTLPGSYAFHCTLHPFMQGTIVVK